MAVLGRLLLGSSERLDLPDILSVDSFTAADFKFLMQTFVGGENPYVLKGFDVIQPQDAIATEGISIRVAESVVYFPGSNAGSFFVGLEEGNTAAEPLVPELRKNATNFIYLTFSTTDAAQDGRAFWDPDQNGGAGGEFSQDINTQTALTVEVNVSISSFPENTIPICKVVVGPSVISSIEDSRNMMFRLGSGGIAPNPFNDFGFRDLPSSAYARSEPAGEMTNAAQPNPFQGGDKNLFTLKEWMDVVMTRIKELGGTTYWYEGGAGGSSAPNVSDTFLDALGSTLKSKGEWSHDGTIAGRVTWTEDIQYISLIDPRVLIFRANTIDISSDDNVAYFTIIRDDDINGTNQAVDWVNGSNTVNGVVGAFGNLSKGDWVKQKSDASILYLRVEELYSDPNLAGSATTGALAQSIKLSGNYAGSTGSFEADYTKGEYLLTDITISSRDAAGLTATGNDFYWLAARSDTILTQSLIARTDLTVDIADANGTKAKVTSIGHGLQDGDRVTIVAPSVFAGTFKIEVETIDTFFIDTATISADEVSQTAHYAIITTGARATTDGYSLESAEHNFENDQRIQIADTLSSYDGSHLINVRSVTQLQIPIGSALTPPAASVGTIELPRVNVRTEFGAVKVVQGESIDIGDADTSNILSFIGMGSLAQTKPVYSTPTGYNALHGQQDFNSSITDDLTERVSKLTSMMADRVQDRGTIITDRVSITSQTNAGNQDITATGTMTLRRPGSDDQIITPTVSLAANTVGYITMDRNTGAALTVSTESIGSPSLLAENKLILFRRFSGQEVYTWDDKRLDPFDHFTYNKPEDAQNRNIIFQIPGAVKFNSGTGLVTLDMSKVAEQSSVACSVATSVAPGSYFTFSSANNVTDYYVWYTLDAAGADPAPGGTAIGPVALITGDTADDVATKTALAIDAIGDFNSSSLNADVTITNVVVGPADDIADGGTATNFIFTVLCQGVAAEPTMVIPGSANDNEFDSDAINGLGTLVLTDQFSAWVRVNRDAAKEFDTIQTDPTIEDTDISGAIYITLTDLVPIDHDVFVLFSRVGDNLIQHHPKRNADGNVYEESITIVAGLPANNYEVQGPIAIGTLLTLPPDTRDGNSPQTYLVGEGQLEVFKNGNYQCLSADWLEVGPAKCESNKIQTAGEIFEIGDKITLRIDANGAVFFASAGSGVGGGSLQTAYDGGRTITTQSGQPIVISGPASEKLMIIQGDLDVTGIIDPKGMEITNEATNPLSSGAKGIWVDNNNDLRYEDGVTSYNLIDDFLRRDGTVAMLAALDFGTFKGINAADPIDPQDLATKNYIDNDFYKRDGSSPLTGTMDASSNKIIGLPDPVDAQGASTMNYTDVNDNLRLKRDGTDAMTGDLDFGTNKGVNLVDPTAAQDASTKNYTDTADLLRLLLDGTAAMTGALNFGAFKGINAADPTALQDVVTLNYLNNNFTTVGSIVTFTNGDASTINIGDAVFASKTTAKEVLLANAATIDSSEGFIGIATETILPAASGKIQLNGEATISVPLSGLTVGEEVFLSTTDGKLTDIPPSTIGGIVYQVGYATSTSTIVLNPKFRFANEVTYEEDILIVSGAPSGPNEVTGPTAPSTVFTLPLNTRDGSSVKDYVVGRGDLEIYLNGQILERGIGYTEIGAINAVSTTVTIIEAMDLTDRLVFRDNHRSVVLLASGAGAVSVLNDLLDVDAGSPTNGDGIFWNSGSSMWESGAPLTSVAMNDITDVDAAAPANNDILKFNTGSGNYELSQETGEANTASNLGVGLGAVFKQKTGTDLEFRKIKGGDEIDVTTVGDDICVDLTRASTYFVEYQGSLWHNTPVLSSNYVMNTNALLVHRNGVLLVNSPFAGISTDRYVEMTRNQVQIDPGTPILADDIFSFVNQDAEPTYLVHSSNQTGTVICVPTYVQGNDTLRVFRNGIIMNTVGLGLAVEQYTETTVNTITLAQTATASDIFIIMSTSAVPTSRSDIDGETGVVISPVPTYTLGTAELLVYKNGKLLLNSTILGTAVDRYQETSTTSITLEVAPVASDSFTFIVK